MKGKHLLRDIKYKEKNDVQKKHYKQRISMTKIAEQQKKEREELARERDRLDSVKAGLEIMRHNLEREQIITAYRPTYSGPNFGAGRMMHITIQDSYGNQIICDQPFTILPYSNPFLINDSCNKTNQCKDILQDTQNMVENLKDKLTDGEYLELNNKLKNVFDKIIN